MVLAHARTADQQKIMEGILERGECPFARNLPEGNEIIRKTSYWFLMPNMWPYENTKVHLVAVHITMLKDWKIFIHTNGPIFSNVDVGRTKI